MTQSCIRGCHRVDRSGEQAYVPKESKRVDLWGGAEWGLGVGLAQIGLASSESNGEVFAIRTVLARR